MNQITHPFERPRMRIAKAAPAPHRALVALSKSVELDSTLRELVNLRASIVNGCAYCIDTHTKEARRAGESEQRLYALAAWRDAPLFSDRERAALALTDAITLISDEHVPCAVWDEASAQFSDDELAVARRGIAGHVIGEPFEPLRPVVREVLVLRHGLRSAVAIADRHNGNEVLRTIRSIMGN